MSRSFFHRLLPALLVIALTSIDSVWAQRTTDHLDRGLVAVKNASGVFTSWRRFGEEYYNTQYNLYRDGTKLNATPLTVSNFTDAGGSLSSSYTVRAVVRGVEQEPCEPVKPWNQPYLSIPVKNIIGRDGSDVTSLYSLNDVTLADVDGDGTVELIVKRPCSAVADLSNKRAFHVLDCYTLKGERLWWIDMGPNMLSGADEVWDCVGYDWDQDGKAEIVLRGADNMIIHHPDGSTTEIGSMTVDTRWDGIEYTSTGNEYLLYLEGATANIYKKMTYPLPRGNDNDWGSGIVGHRSTKHFFGAPFLDGRHASLFVARGIYTKHHMKAFDIDPVTHDLVLRWEWKSDGLPGSWFGQGYHNYGIADVDLDGRDEIVYGSMVIDDNGKGLSTTGLGHGDAQHIGDFNPYRPGLEFFACNESSPSCNLRDATTSEMLYRLVGTNDDGRGLCGNFTNDYPGAVAASTQSGMISCVAAKPISGQSLDLPLNFRIYWDGDLLEETVNSPGTERECIVEKRGKGRILQTSGIAMCNWTKNTPPAQGDILGDWREELVLRTSDNKYLRIYTTTDKTVYPISTLWHDHQYRNAMVWQSLGYNQPPHTSFFLGELEGITKEPPPLTMTGRTEILNGQTIGKEYDGQHVILCETNSMEATLAEGAEPDIITVNAPSWVQGNNNNESIERVYYNHDLRGTLTGNTRLVKQGGGTLQLSGEEHTTHGNIDLWDGTISLGYGSGTFTHANLWMNRFTTFTGCLTSGGNITMEYGATFNPHNMYIKCICPGWLKADTLSMHIGSRIRFYLIGDNDETPECDAVTVNRLELQTKHWNYGPEFMAPVFEFIRHGNFKTGRFPILQAGEIEGNLSDIVIKGLEGVKAKLVQEGNTVFLVIDDVRSASSVVWTGAESNVWDFAGTPNFLLSSDGTTDVFVGGDKVTFGDEGQQLNVTLNGELPCDTLIVEGSKNYNFSGSGSIAGTTTLLKRGTGTLTLNTDNTYTGGTRIEGGTVKISSLANSVQVKGNLGSVTTKAAEFVLADGAVLQTTAAVTCGSPIQLEGTAGAFIDNTADFIMEKPFSGTTLTKKGAGWMKLNTSNTALSRLIVAAGTVQSINCSVPAKTVEFQGGTLVEGQGTSYAIYVPEGKKGSWNLANRAAYSNRLTGKGTITIYCPVVVGSGWNATRTNITGNWSEFEGTVKPTGYSGDGRFTLDNASGLPKGTLDIAAGVIVQNSGKTWKIGAVTGTGALGGGCTFNNNSSAGTNTWQVGSLGTDFEFGGTVTGGATRFEKVGDGIMTLTGQGSDHTGTNTVTAGTLCLNNSKASKAMLGTGTLTVKTGTALTGTGLLANAVTLNSGALLRPGLRETSLSGTISFSGKNVTVSKGATLQLMINGGSLFTKLADIGTFTLNGTLVVRVREEASGLTVGKEFALWTASKNTFAPSDLVLDALPEGLYWDITDLSSGILRVTDDPVLAIRQEVTLPSLVSTEYYDLRGQRIASPTGGIVIIRQTFSDGSVVTRKMK